MFLDLVFCFKRILRVHIFFSQIAQLEIPLFLVLWKMAWAGESQVSPVLSGFSVSDLRSLTHVGCADRRTPSAQPAVLLLNLAHLTFVLLFFLIPYSAYFSSEISIFKCMCFLKIIVDETLWIFFIIILFVVNKLK